MSLTDPQLDALEAAARRAKPGPYRRRYQKPRMHSLASDCILSAAEGDDPDVALADVWIPLPEAGEDALRQQDGLAQMWSLLDPSTVLSLLSQLREARAERDVLQHRLIEWPAAHKTQEARAERMEAEVASLTAIRERAVEVERQPGVGADMRCYAVVRQVARFILGAAPSPEPPPAPVVADPRLMGKRS